MDADSLARSATTETQPPTGLNDTERALWLAKAGRWTEAHDLCQDLPDPGGAWIHAWLHREEGDYGNACYWYARAGKPPTPRGESLDAEWMDIARALLSRS